MALEQLKAFGSTYDSVNGGIHRRTASIVGVPSIVRHVGFWSEIAAQDNRAEEFVAYLADLRNVVETGGGGTIEYGEKDLPDPSAAKEVRIGTIRVIRFWWYGIRARIRIEFRTEYIMITSILDMSLRPHENYRAPGDGVDNLAETKAKLDRLAALFRAGVATPDEQLQSEYFDIARFLQYTLWERFERAVLDAPRTPGTILGARFGQVFADFRGVITGSELALTPKLGKPCAEQKLRPAFDRHWNQHRNRDIQHDKPDERWARDSLRRLWPLIEPHEYLREFRIHRQRLSRRAGAVRHRAGAEASQRDRLRLDMDAGLQLHPLAYGRRMAARPPRRPRQEFGDAAAGRDRGVRTAGRCWGECRRPDEEAAQCE